MRCVPLPRQKDTRTIARSQPRRRRALQRYEDDDATPEPGELPAQCVDRVRAEWRQVEEEWRTRRGRDSLKHVLVRRLVRAVQQWQDLYGPLTADELDRLWAQARAQLLAADTPPSS